jgi:hypothetical protein
LDGATITRMNLQTIFVELESPAFASKLELANDLPMFFEALRAEPCISRLVKQASADAAVAQEILRRIASLLRTSVDVRYRNPYDSAVAAYVWILAETYPSLSRLAANAVVSTGKLWWASKIAVLAIEEKLPKIRRIYEHRRSVPLYGLSPSTAKRAGRSSLLTSSGASADILRDGKFLKPGTATITTDTGVNVVNELLPHNVDLKPSAGSWNISFDNRAFTGKQK